MPRINVGDIGILRNGKETGPIRRNEGTFIKYVWIADVEGGVKSWMEDGSFLDEAIHSEDIVSIKQTEVVEPLAIDQVTAAHLTRGVAAIWDSFRQGYIY